MMVAKLAGELPARARITMMLDTSEVCSTQALPTPIVYLSCVEDYLENKFVFYFVLIL